MSNMQAKSFNIQMLLLIVLLAAFAIFIGILASFYPWFVMLPMMLLPIFVVVGWHAPEILLIFSVLCTSDLLPTADAKLSIVSIVLVTLIVLFKWPTKLRQVFRTYRIQMIGIGFVLLLAILSSFYGYFYRGNFRSYVISEFLVLLSWMLFPVCAMLCENPVHAKRLMFMTISLVVLISLVSVVQSITGTHLFLNAGARLDLLDSSSGGMAGLYRSLAPGNFFIVFGYFYALVAVVRGEGRRWFWSVVLVITAAAIFVNFGRALWAITALVTFLLGFFLGLRQAAKYWFLILLLGFTVILTTGLVKSEVLQAAFDRITSVQSEGGSGSSLGWRITENFYAKRAISDSPIIGLGLGAEYKPPLVRFSEFSEQTRYIHNAYLYIMLKTGLIGLLIILVNYFFLILNTLRGGSLKIEGSAPRVAAFGLLLTIPMLSFTQPELFTASSNVAIAVLIPLAWSVSTQRNQNVPPAST